MNGIVGGFSEGLRGASSADECLALMFEVTKSFGFTAFAYDYTPVLRAHDGTVIPPNLLRTFGMPADFDELWLRRGYYAKDVAWLACHTTTEPFVWSCDSCLVGEDANVHLDSGPQYREMFDYMADMRLTVGINVPVHGPHGGLATVNALCFDPERDLLKDALQRLAPFADCAHRLQTAVTRFFDRSILCSQHIRLSEREIACLRLSAQGFTTEQIADHIYRSVPTAALHLKNAAAKLGARNRAQAVARAAHYRLLDGAC